MWFLGFSTKHVRSFFVLGAILGVILLTLILRKFLLYLEAQAILKEGGGKSKKSGNCVVCCKAVLRTYGLEEMKLATRNFRVRVGVGATAFVYLAELGDGRFGAVKRVMEERGGTKKMFLDEVSVLLRISHPNLVGLLGFCLEAGEQLLLLEYVPNKSLFDRMHTRLGQIAGALSWSSRLSIALDIALALNYLHSEADPPVIHRDVKSSNILLIDNNHAKLADFGLCKLGFDSHVSQTPCIIKGSFGYVDVNYVKTGIVSVKSDVYSFGVLLLELITGLRSMQGSVTLPEWTEEHRKSKDPNDWVTLLDPKLKGNADMEQLKVMINLANSALVENCEGRPDMNWIVDRIYSCMEAQPPTPELPV